MRRAWWVLALGWSCDDAPEATVVPDAGPDAMADAAAATPDAAVDAAIDAAIEAPWACPDGWTHATDGITCEPDPARPCPPGVDEACAPWPCVDGWVDDGDGCGPPEPEECGEGRFAIPGGCSAEWPCPDGWLRHEVLGLGCFAPPDPCPRGSHGAWTGECDDLGVGEAACADFVPPEAPDAVVLEAGVHVFERLEAVTLVGTCATQVELQVDVLGPGVVLHDVTLLAEEAPPVVEAGARVTLRRVRVVGAESGVVLREGAELAAEAIALDGAGEGVQVEAGAHFECHRCAFDGPGGVRLGGQQGLEALGGRVTLRGASFRGFDIAMSARRDAALDLEDVRVIDSDSGVRVQDATTRIRRLAVTGGLLGVSASRGTTDIEDASFAGNWRTDVAVSRGTMNARRISADGRIVVDASTRSAVDCVGATGVLRLDQAVVVEPGNIGVSVSECDAEVAALRVDGGSTGAAAVGGRLQIDGARLTRNRVGLSSESIGPRRSEPDSDPEAGRRGVLTARRVHVGTGAPAPGDRWVGVFVGPVGRWHLPHADLEDVHLELGEHPSMGAAVVEGSLAARRLSMAASGAESDRAGVVVAAGRVTLEGATLELPRGVAATRASEVELTDVRIDNRAWLVDAIDVVGEAQVDARRLTLQSDGAPGVVVEGSGARLTAEAVRASGTANLAAVDGGRLEVRDARLDGPVASGVAAAGAGTVLDLAGVWIRQGAPAFLGPRFAGVSVSGDAAGVLTDVTVDETNGGVGVLAVLAQVEVQRLAISGGRGVSDGLRIDSGAVSGAEVLLRGMPGPGLVVIDGRVQLARAAVLRNEVGLLRQGENEVALDPARVEGNETRDDVCDQCSETPPEVAAPTPVPPL